MSLAKIIKIVDPGVNAYDLTICLIGIFLFAFWLLKTSLGRKALADAPLRRNNLPIIAPFIPFFVWFAGATVAIGLRMWLLPNLPEWKQAFIDNIALCLVAIVAMGIISYQARKFFARRLTGFGLNIKTIHKDFLAAVTNLLSVWPLVLLAFMLTMIAGKIIYGPEFEMQQHRELEIVTAHSQIPLRIIILITTIIVVPLFEEMLFRGLFQTLIRSFMIKPWRSIAATSVLFACSHPNPQHWPALFALSVCIGYSYEKSGSILRPFFIHAIFNATSVIATMFQ